jgi:ribonuclease J
MPFHGDFRMLKVHGLLAQEMGVPIENVFVCKNGEVIVGEENKDKKMIFTLSDEKVLAEPDYIFNQKVIKGDW